MDGAPNPDTAPEFVPHDYKTTHPRKLAFLTALGMSGVIVTACRTARVGRRNVYIWLDQQGPEGDEFRADFATAKENAADFLQSEVIKRALQGYEEPLIYKGQVVKDEKGKIVMRAKYYPALLIYATNLAKGINIRGERVNNPKPEDETLKRMTPADAIKELARSMGLRPEEDALTNGDTVHGNGHGAPRLNGH